MIPSDLFRQAHTVPMRRFQTIAFFKSPHLRAPILEEMQEDLNRLITKVARQYQDMSCPELNFDELEAEGRLKLVHVLDEEVDVFNRAPTRVAFFRYFSTALNNHVRSLVHKYRFTEKRTGVKPPPKEDRFKSPELLTETRIKSVEVRLDDEEIGVQVAAQADTSAQEHEFNEYRDDLESALMPMDVDPLEVMVYRQLIEPNAESLMYARMDAMRGHVPGDCLNIKIKTEHLARGLRGVDGEPLNVAEFEQIVLRVRQKITAHRSMTPPEEQEKVRYNAAIAQLEQVFNLQIPRSIDKMVVARLLTICARDQYDKVKDNAQIQELLACVGAKVPRAHGGVLTCRGVLFSRNNRICNSCGYRGPCETEAANFGLNKITIAPRLLGAKSTRIPAILPNSDGYVQTIPAPTREEMEVVDYLDENFSKTPSKGRNFYVHKERLGAALKFLFRVDTDGVDFKLIFCNPSDDMKQKLRYESKCYFAPPGLPVNEIIALIDTHAEEMYAIN